MREIQLLGKRMPHSLAKKVAIILRTSASVTPSRESSNPGVSTSLTLVPSAVSQVTAST